jgi:hypothetical protein
LTFYDFAAHLEKFDGTLVRRGTPVEKHCLTLSKMSNIFFYNHVWCQNRLRDEGVKKVELTVPHDIRGLANV